jgi:hypothetical protein
MYVIVVRSNDADEFETLCDRALADENTRFQGNMVVSSCYDSKRDEVVVTYAQMFVSE